MNSKFVINTSISIPIYKQVISQIEQKIISGEYSPGFQLPSMNKMASSLDVSKETIKKAYSILRDKGVIEPKQGKGFYVRGMDEDRPPRILLLFDKLSSYKQVLFQSFTDTIGESAEITIQIHYQNLDVFEFFVDESVDNYDYYVVTPHFPLDTASQKRMLKLLKRFPYRKLILLDRKVDALTGNYGCVYQDFSKDITDTLINEIDALKEFSCLHVITMPNSLYGKEINKAIEKCCINNSFPVKFHTEINDSVIKPNEVYLMLNSQHDDGLLKLARTSAQMGLVIGEDIKLISYNDSPINELILNGLTTVSTDFKQMGEMAAQMILDGKLSKQKCDFRMIRRATF